ncbi:MAG: DNA polymerase III subunit [Solirubrobacterales bacterium]
MALAEAALPAALAEATRHQPRARAALGAALATGPTHAYLFRGPAGSGKRAAARTFAAELLALGAPDPESARRRALLDPSPHPDLVWLRPPGAQHLVDDVRESVIRAASLRPVEGERRVFVIEEAEGLRDESQNALLKTLEEPAGFAHLILVCSEAELLAGTILSRCQAVEFAPLAPEAVTQALGASGPEAEAVARLCEGDLALARFLLSDAGRALRAGAEAAARAARNDPEAAEPYRALLDSAERAGAEAGAEEERRLLELADQGGRRGRSGKLTREATDQVKRTERRARTQALDLGLALCCAWYRDMAALAAGAGEVVLNTDRGSELAADAEGIEPAAAREAVEWVLDTRRRLRLNVSEELALQALWLRLAESLEA